MVFLPGAWRCAAPDAGTRTLIFVRSGKGLVESDGASTMTIEPDRHRIWRLRGQDFAGWAFPWIDDAWLWSAHLSKDNEVRLRRIDDATFELASTSASERCTRVAAAP